MRAVILNNGIFKLVYLLIIPIGMVLNNILNVEIKFYKAIGIIFLILKSNRLQNQNWIKIKYIL